MRTITVENSAGVGVATSRDAHELDDADDVVENTMFGGRSTEYGSSGKAVKVVPLTG